LPVIGGPVVIKQSIPPPLIIGEVEKNAPAIMRWTENKWMMWFDNFAQNIPWARTGLNYSDMKQRPGPAIIVGGGPSVRKYDHLSLLSKHRDRIPTLIATDIMLKPLIQVDATPDIVATVDGSPMVSEFYKLHSDERGAKVDAVLDVVTTHPLTVKAVRENLKGQVWWFSHIFDEFIKERCPTCNRLSLTAATHFMSGKKGMMETGGNVGALCWNLAYGLGCNPIILIGMDMSYPNETPIERTVYYNAFMKTYGLDLTKKNLFFATRENPDFHNKYLIDPVFETYATILLSGIRQANTTTINATGGGALHGEKVVAMGFEEALRKYC